MLKFDKLIALLEKNGIKKTALRNYGFSPNLIYRMENNGNVNTVNIDKLCNLLQCQPGDIMQWVPDDIDEHDSNT